MQAKEIIEVNGERAGCDGGGGSMGHPKVYLSLTDKPAIDCPYCGRRFVRSAGAEAASH